MHELETDQLAIAKPVFARLLFATPVAAILEGSSPARVFVDDVEHPTAGFVWTRWGYFYLAGGADSEGTRARARGPAESAIDPRFVDRLAERLRSELIPDSVRIGERWPVLFPDGPQWESHVPVLLGSRHVRRLARRSFSSYVSPPLVNVSLPRGGEGVEVRARTLEPGQTSSGRDPRFSLRRIDPALLEAHPSLAATVRATWTTLELFHRRGFGFSVLADGAVVATCHACFSAGRRVEIQVATEERFRRRGLAHVAAQAFLKECADRNLAPTWECWWNNTPSTVLAERLGFGAPVDHPVFWWEEPA